MYLIILTGAPAVGKSSIASVLSEQLSIPLISKDEFKISLFEKHGFNNHDQKKQLSLLGENMMYEMIENYVHSNKNLLVDNNFKNFERIRDICKKNKDMCTIICLNFFADFQILANRYNNRITTKNRHEALYTLDVYPIVQGISHFHNKITAADVKRIQEKVTECAYGDYIININTNNISYDFDFIVEKCKSFILSAMEG